MSARPAADRASSRRPFFLCTQALQKFSPAASPHALRLGRDLEGVLEVRVLGHLGEQRQAADLGEGRLVPVVEGDEHGRIGLAGLRGCR